MTETISLNHLTKIEGHATLALQIDGMQIKKCELSSVEGSRYFEGILKGHYYYEASEISSRICGICSCAHTVAAIIAIERALDVTPSPQTVALRKLLTIGERIRSHATHFYFLAVPDYLGYESALSMLPKYKKEIQRALKMMKVGNEIIKVVGGRDLHPVSATVGGFLKFPPPEQILDLKTKLGSIAGDVEETAKFIGSLKNPDYSHRSEYFSLYNGRTYSIFMGHIRSKSNDFTQKEYHKYIKEYHEPYSTANFVVKEGKSYMVGALARLNNNHSHLNQPAKKLVKSLGLKFPFTNPFMNNLAQAIELVHYVDRGMEICASLKNVASEPLKKIQVKEGHGISAIEVPRGTLWHEYVLDKEGKITYANIVTPTAQNLRNMQDDIRDLLPGILHLPNNQLVVEIEKLIRSYDPCFSCSTHFLKVKWLKGSKNRKIPSQKSNK